MVEESNLCNQIWSRIIHINKTHEKKSLYGNKQRYCGGDLNWHVSPKNSTRLSTENISTGTLRTGPNLLTLPGECAEIII